jgi:hypothetical protein
VAHLVLAHAHRRRLVAAPDARRFLHVNILAQLGRLQASLQVRSAGHGTRQAGAHPHRHARRGTPIVQKTEVVIEAGDLENLGLAQAQALGQGGQVGGAQALFGVLKPVQVFDQQVAPQRQPLAQGSHPGPRSLGRYPALRGGARPRRGGQDGNDGGLHNMHFCALQDICKAQ